MLSTRSDALGRLRVMLADYSKPSATLSSLVGRGWSDNGGYMDWSVKFNQRGHLPSNSLSSYLACMKRTLSTWHVHHAHTAPDLPAAQTVDYIGDRSKGPYWRWGSLPGQTRLLLLEPVRGAYFGRRNSSSSAAGYIERAVVWTRTQRVHDRVDMAALAD